MAPPHLWAHSEHQDMEQEELRLEFVLIFNQRENYDKSMLPLAVKSQDPPQEVKELVSFELFQFRDYSILNLEIVENSNVKL